MAMLTRPPPVCGQQLLPRHPQRQCWGRPWRWALRLGAPMSLGTYSFLPTLSNHAAVTGEFAVLSSHSGKTHPGFWSSSARWAPWAAEERSPSGAHPEFSTVALSGVFISFRVGTRPSFFPTVPSPGGRKQQVSTESLPAHCDHGRRHGQWRRSVREDMKSIL